MNPCCPFDWLSIYDPDSPIADALGPRAINREHACIVKPLESFGIGEISTLIASLDKQLATTGPRL
jgi:hypothetical protein